MEMFTFQDLMLFATFLIALLAYLDKSECSDLSRNPNL